MLKKAIKGQVIKNIKKEDAFKSGNVFYLPIEIHKPSAEFFDVESLIVSYIPDTFIQNYTTVSMLESKENEGFKKSAKPLYVNSKSKNLNYFDEKDIEEFSSSNRLYRTIYSKNIASTFGQEIFLEDATPINFSNNDSEDITVACRSSIDLIKQKTCTLNSESMTPIMTPISSPKSSPKSNPRQVKYRSGDALTLPDLTVTLDTEGLSRRLDRGSRELDAWTRNRIANSADAGEVGNTTEPSIDLDKDENKDIRELFSGKESDNFHVCFGMKIKVYALNKKGEVVDKLEIKSIAIDRYSNSTNSEIEKSLMLENRLSFFAEDFLMEFRPYSLPIQTNISNNIPVNGPILSYSNSRLNSIFFNFSNIESIDVTLSSDLINKNFKVKTFTSGSNSLVDSTSQRDFSIALLGNTDFVDFVIESKNYIDNNNLSFLNVAYSFNVILENKDINIFNESIIDKESINQIYNDILFYKFEKDISSGNVINVEIEKIDINVIENIYKIKINLNTENYLREQILQNAISFNFFNLTGEPIVGIENFYFDENLTDNNKLSSRLLSLDNIFFENNTAIVYIRNPSVERDLIKECELLFHSDISPNPISIGIFKSKIHNIDSLVTNVFEDCASKIGDLINPKSNFKNYPYDIIINNIDPDDTFVLSIGKLSGDISFKKIGYFSTSTNESEKERLNEIINNTLVKVTKSIKINNLELNRKSGYYLLSDLCKDIDDSLNCKLNTSSLKISDFNIRQSISRNSTIKNIYDILINVNSLERLSQITDEFNAKYEVLLDFAVLENNTVVNFGEDTNIDQSRENLIDFITFNNNNFEMSRTIRLTEAMFSDSFFENKSSMFEEIYRQSDILDTTDYKSEAISQIQDFVSLRSNNVNQLPVEDNIFTSDISRLNDFNFENVQVFSSNIKLSNVNRNFSIIKEVKNEKLLEIRGNNISRLIRSFRRYENSTILKSYCKLEYKFKNSLPNPTFNINDIERRGFTILESDDDSSCIFLFKEEEENSLPITVNMHDDSIHCDIIRENEYFEKFSSNDYYDSVASLIGKRLSRRRDNTSESYPSLIVKNIILRIYIILTINGKRNIMLCNVPVEPDLQMKEYIRLNSPSFQRNYLNLDVVDSSKVIYKPSIIYKGSTRQWLLNFFKAKTRLIK